MRYSELGLTDLIASSFKILVQMIIFDDDGIFAGVSFDLPSSRPAVCSSCTGVP